MLDLLQSRRALASGVTVLAAGIVALLVSRSPEWRVLLRGPSQASLPSVASSDRTGSLPPAPIGLASAQPSPDGLAKSVGSEPGLQTAVEPTPKPPGQAIVPSFDIVRVTPDGESVIAARAAPNTDITLMDGDTVLARGRTDAGGQVAFLPSALKPGEHSLVLLVGGQGATSAGVSSQIVAVSVPEQPKAASLVAVIQPDASAKILSGPVAGTPEPTGQAPAAASTTDPAASTVAIQSVEVEDQGSFYAGGKAAPDAQCRIYLNGSLVATVTADGKGLWSLQIKRGMKPGRYAVRVDQLEAKTGKVVARAEVPFDYPVGAASGVSLADRRTGAGEVHATASGGLQPTGAVGSTAAGKTADASGATGGDPAAPASTVINQLMTARVTRGDTLWRISRKMLGHGMRYTQIYAANTQQIRNPRLIYPGQIFVMPQIEVR